MFPRIVSHTRTGTHYLAKLLWSNFRTGYGAYEELHFSHSRVPPEPYIHLHRPLFPVMLSVWRAREHLGIAKSVSFSAMLRTPWEAMPRAESCEAVYNGVATSKVCSPKEFFGTLPQRWLDSTTLFARSAAYNAEYSWVVERPMAVLQEVARAFKVKRNKEFVPVLERVGWWSADEETPSISADDMYLMEAYQCRLFL